MLGERHRFCRVLVSPPPDLKNKSRAKDGLWRSSRKRRGAIGVMLSSGFGIGRRDRWWELFRRRLAFVYSIASRCNAREKNGKPARGAFNKAAGELMPLQDEALHSRSRTVTVHTKVEAIHESGLNRPCWLQDGGGKCCRQGL